MGRGGPEEPQSFFFQAKCQRRQVKQKRWTFHTEHKDWETVSQPVSTHQISEVL